MCCIYFASLGVELESSLLQQVKKILGWKEEQTNAELGQDLFLPQNGFAFKLFQQQLLSLNQQQAQLLQIELV